MFTGLVEKVGILAGRSGDRLRIRVSEPFRDLVRGESIAVNGCCLTLERELPDRTMEFFTLAETLSKTNLGELATGSPVTSTRPDGCGASDRSTPATGSSRWNSRRNWPRNWWSRGASRSTACR